MTEAANSPQVFPNKRAAMRAAEALGSASWTVEPVAERDVQKPWRLTVWPTSTPA